ncbi:hypothetical protein PCANB_002892 [Pneumocystis canis]|nr:hypothetical protein PCK1_002902 [Pneumocystis canis]KAG5438403.1 hypothetical protein PCANB_002892 [Pneumocystis canis]
MKYKSKSPGEIFLAAYHQENPNLLNQILNDDSADIYFLNNSTNKASIACLNILLNIKDLRVNSGNFLEENTPLHKTVEYQYKDKDITLEMIEYLINGDSDPKIKNKMKQKPIDLVDQENIDIQDILKKAELTYQKK